MSYAALDDQIWTSPKILDTWYNGRLEEPLLASYSERPSRDAGQLPVDPRDALGIAGFYGLG
jgi:hypothetical protein